MYIISIVGLFLFVVFRVLFSVLRSKNVTKFHIAVHHTPVANPLFTKFHCSSYTPFNNNDNNNWSSGMLTTVANFYSYFRIRTVHRRTWWWLLLERHEFSKDDSKGILNEMPTNTISKRWTDKLLFQSLECLHVQWTHLLCCGRRKKGHAAMGKHINVY